MKNEKIPENTPVEQVPASPEATGAADSKPTTFQSKITKRKRTALLRYMGVMFAAAFLLVLISFVSQMRASNATISTLSASAAGSLARAEQLQEENRQLQEDLTTTRGYVTAAREEGVANVDNTKTAYDALLLVLSTTEPEEGDVAYSKAVETVKNMKSYLSEEAYAMFEETLAARETPEEQ